MGRVIYQVDAFTDRPFSGNPAAVCILPGPGAEDWMQSVAMEMNLSETAFLHPEADGYRLRWFTPTTEVDLCGHATLASAHILWEIGQLTTASTARFYTRSGLLTVERKGDRMEMDFPADPVDEVMPPSGLIESLGFTPRFVGRGRFDFLAVAESEQMVRTLKPNLGRLQEIAARGVIVTSLSQSPEYDFISRFFAPAAGVTEDPVTGSTHCCLGPFWSERTGKKVLNAYQASARGGEMLVEVNGDRVLLRGHAVTVLKGELASSFD